MAEFARGDPRLAARRQSRVAGVAADRRHGAAEPRARPDGWPRLGLVISLHLRGGMWAARPAPSAGYRRRANPPGWDRGVALACRSGCPHAGPPPDLPFR